MKAILIAAALLLAGSLSQPAAAQSTCGEAFAACQKVQDGNRCDVVCKAYCTKQKKACMNILRKYKIKKGALKLPFFILILSARFSKNQGLGDC